MWWYWRVRIYNPSGLYGIGQIRTEQRTQHIDDIQDFYKTLTGCRMLLEGMSEKEYDVPFVDHIFKIIFDERPQ